MQTNKLCQHSVCSLKSLSRCISLHRRVSAGLCLSNTATWLISSFPISYILRFLSFPSFTSSLPPSLHATSPPPFPPPLQSSSARAQAGRQAGRLPGWGPRWCSGESASSGSLSLQDGRTALLWPIWPRPVLAPVCDYGPAGGWQGSHSERTVPVHSRLGDCGGTHSHTDM